MAAASRLLSTCAVMVGVAALLAAGCATAPPDPGVFVSSPVGTVTTYHRQASGSYGTVDTTVVWTQGERQWQGRTVVASVSQGFGGALHDPTTHAVIATLDNAGQPTMSYDPPIAWAWPLTVGKAWTSKHSVTMHATQRTVPLEISFKVEAQEDMTVPAGTFKTYRIVSTDSFGEVQQVWTTPSLGLPTVKRVDERPATHPQGLGRRQAVLTSQVRPK